MSGTGIFISHSCKDGRTEAEFDGSPEAWDRLVYARQVRDALVDALKHDAKLEPLHDRRLRPGDPWRAELYRWLGACRAAVILLDVDSAKQEWLIRETTILTWRKQLGEPLLLVPVLMRGFTPEKGPELESLQLFDSQAVPKPGGPELTAGQLAQCVLEELRRVPPSAEGTPVGMWAEKVASVLDSAGENLLRQLAAELGELKYKWRDRASLVLAHLLLHTDYDRVKTTIEQLRDVLPEAQRELLVELLTPGLVDEGRARHLRAILDAKSELPLLSVSDEDDAKTFVRRAFCCKVPMNQFLGCTDVVPEHPEEAVAAFERAVREEFSIEDDETIEEVLGDTNEERYVLMGQSWVRPDVLVALNASPARRWMHLVLRSDAPASEASGTALVKPALDAAAVKRLSRRRAALERVI